MNIMDMKKLYNNYMIYVNVYIEKMMNKKNK